MVKMLLKAGAHPYARHADSESALHVAVEKNALSIMRLLISRMNELREEFQDDEDGENRLVDPRTWLEGKTPLHMAAEAGRLAMVRLLLDQEANPNAATDDNETPLSLAAAEGHSRIARLLLGAKAHVNGADNASPLGAAAAAGDLRMVKLLLDAGADVNARHRGATPLHLAKESRSASVIRLLESNGAQDAFTPPPRRGPRRR